MNHENYNELKYDRWESRHKETRRVIPEMITICAGVLLLASMGPGETKIFGGMLRSWGFASIFVFYRGSKSDLWNALHRGFLFLIIVGGGLLVFWNHFPGIVKTGIVLLFISCLFLKIRFEEIIWVIIWP